MVAQDVIRQLCKLQAEVMGVVDPGFHSAADCFCGEGGFRLSRFDPNYRNEMKAIEFIERAVRTALQDRDSA